MKLVAFVIRQKGFTASYRYWQIISISRLYRISRDLGLVSVSVSSLEIETETGPLETETETETRPLETETETETGFFGLETETETET